MIRASRASSVMRLRKLPGHPEEHVDTRRLDVRVHDPDPLAPGREQGRDVGRHVRLARATAEGMDRDDLRHALALAV